MKNFRYAVIRNKMSNGDLIIEGVARLCLIIHPDDACNHALYRVMFCDNQGALDLEDGEYLRFVCKGDIYSSFAEAKSAALKLANKE